MITCHYDVCGRDAASALRNVQERPDKLLIDTVEVALLEDPQLSPDICTFMGAAAAVIPNVRNISVQAPQWTSHEIAQNDSNSCQWAATASMIRSAKPKLYSILIDHDDVLEEEDAALLAAAINLNPELKCIVFSDHVIASPRSHQAILVCLCGLAHLERAVLPSVRAGPSIMRGIEGDVLTLVGGPALRDLEVRPQAPALGMVQLIETLYENTTLTKLTIPAAYTEAGQAAFCIALKRLFQRNRTLEEINITHLAEISGADFSSVVPDGMALKGNTSLRQLSFRANNNRTIWKGIPKAYRLYFRRMEDFQMAAPKVESFKELLRDHNSVLEHLEVDGSSMSQDTEFYLILNRQRLRWLLDTDENPKLSADECQAALLVHKDDPRIVFCLLSRHPTLVTRIAECGLSVRPQKKVKT